MMAQLAEAGKLTLDDVHELERTIRNLDAEQRTGRKADQKSERKRETK